MENFILNNQKNISNFENTIQKNFEIGKIDTKNLKIPLDSYWKSARNRIQERPSERFYKNLISGVGVTLSLTSTYLNAPIRVQCVSYACTLSYMLMTSPVGLFSRFLSKISRFLLSSANVLMIVCLLTKNNNLWLIWIIYLTVSIILIFFLNDFWIKSENWRMSEEIHHAMTGDDESRAVKSWQANGKRESRSLLYSLGVTVSDSDLDTIFKTIYSLGYWCCIKRDKEEEKKIVRDLEKELADLEYEVIKKNQEIESLNRKIANEENGDSELMDRIKYLEYCNETLKNKELETHDKYIKLSKTYNSLLDSYNDISKKVKIENKEEINEIILKGVTNEKYYEVCEMLDDGANDNHIKNVTGVSVHYIKKIKEIRKG